MTFDKLIQRWYALHTKSRFENVVSDGLSKKKFEVFLPKTRVRSRRKDRKLMIDKPLFPGYVFVKTDLAPNRHLAVLKTVGAVRLLGNKREPLPISEKAIDSLKIMVSTDGAIETGTVFEPGDEVMVIYGPMTGVQGIFSRHHGRDRVIVNIDALGQFASVEVSIDDIERLPKQKKKK